ncbi:WD repeat-containing protein 87 [Dinochytrium kinnereticum]|nr:WD repeat-containing protein 87 [Dinochytrium kinnereticum]
MEVEADGMAAEGANRTDSLLEESEGKMEDAYAAEEDTLLDMQDNESDGSSEEESGEELTTGNHPKGEVPRGGLEQETILVVPWRRIKHIIQPLASRTPAPPSTNNGGHTQGAGALIRKRRTAGNTRPNTNNKLPSGPGKGQEEDLKERPETQIGPRNDVPPPTREVNWADGEPTQRQQHQQRKLSLLRRPSTKPGHDVESFPTPEISSSTSEGEDNDGDDDDSGFRNRHHPARGSTLVAITIPHGFQQLRTLLMPKPTLKSVIYVSSTNNDAFAALDSHGVHLVRGTVRVMNLTTQGGVDGKGRDIGSSPVAGLSRWIYVRKWRMTIIATLHLELKILGLGMEVVSSVSSVKPVLSLEFNEDREELIAGGVGNIRIWSFTKTSMVAYQFSGPRLIIDDLATDEWVTHTMYHRKNNRLYAACENHIMIYDYNTGKRIEGIRNAHELSISAMCIYEPLEYLITGSRDSAIKVWTRHGYLILELKDHSNAPVTGLAIPNSALQGSPSTPSSSPPPLPFLVSTSMDGTIRMWNLEAGHCVYRLETPQECLGLGWMRRDIFYHYSRDRVTVWNLNRYYSTFSYLNSQVTHLSRVELKNRPARILAAAADGSIRLLSPVTGVVLSTAFPVMKETFISGVEYDLATDILWTLSTAGDIAVYSCRTNPCQIIDEWKFIAGRERITCFSALRAAPARLSSKMGSDNEMIKTGTSAASLGVPAHPVFGGTLAIGTDISQLLVYRGTAEGGVDGLTRRHPADEDHTKTITSISCLEALGLFATSSLDGTVKIWDSSESALVREIQFNEPLSSVAFCNRRGDLLVGMSDQIALVKLQDYLPAHYLGLLLNHGDAWPDDPVEYPHKFDSGLDFWEMYREGLEQNGADMSHWHVQNKKQKRVFDEDTMKRIEELEKKRAIAEANRRKRKLLREKEIERLKQQVLYTVQAPIDGYDGNGRAQTRGTPKADNIEEEDEDDMESSGDATTSEGNSQGDSKNDFEEGRLDRMFSEIEDEEVNFKRLAGKEKAKQAMASFKKSEKPEANAKKLKEMYGLDRGRRGSIAVSSSRGPGEGFGDYSREDDENGGAGGNSSGPQLRLKFTLPQVTGTEGGARQTGPLRTFQEINSDRLGNMAPHPVRLERHSTVNEVPEKTAAELRNDQIQAARMAAMAEVANPFAKVSAASNTGGGSYNYDLSQPSVGGGAHKETAPVKHWVRERMAKMGILPNSVVTAQIQEDKRRKQREMQEERERKEKEKQNAAQALSLNPFERPKHLQSRRPKKPELIIEMGEKEEAHVDLQDDVEEEKEHDKDKEALKQKEALERLKKIELEERAAAAERALEKEREAAMELAKRRERERLEREEAEALERARKEEEERLQREAEELARAAAEAARLAKLNYLQQEATKQEDEERPPSPEKNPTLPTIKDLRDRMPLAQPKPLKKKMPQAPPPTDPKSKPDPPRKFTFPERPKREPIARPETVKVTLSESSSVESVQPVVDTRPETALSASTGFPTPEETFTPEDMMEKKLEAKHAWGLFEKASKGDEDMVIPTIQSFDDVSPEFSKVINNFWFPGLGGREVNLRNIIDVLFKLMRNGLWSEKCEASKAVLYLYHTFERDFLDPMTTLIYPQLEFTNDEAWQFRAQMCLNLVGYKIYHHDVIQGLICRLNDKVEAVSSA